MEAPVNMKHCISLAVAALMLTVVSSAQSLPAVDVFGGYSYLNFQVPSSGVTNSTSFKLNGWDAAASVRLFHHLSAEADFSGHQVGDCGGITDINCSDFSYMFGPRFTFGDRSSKTTVFIHGLIGRDRADIFGIGASSTTPDISDTATAVVGGAGLDYWFMRHIGVQLGPVDAFYTNHLSSDGATGQVTFRASAGIAFRFGGDFPQAEPNAKNAQKEPKQKPEYHRSWKRPWHKVPNEQQPGENQPEPQPTTTETAKTQPRAAQPVPAAPSRGMAIHSLGVIAAPQEFNGARILEIEPGSVAEMASLHVGDLVKSVDGKIVRTPMELAAELSDKTGKVRIGIVRGTFATETTILLGGH
jgi:hypothetical protein